MCDLSFRSVSPPPPHGIEKSPCTPIAFRWPGLITAHAARYETPVHEVAPFKEGLRMRHCQNMCVYRLSACAALWIAWWSIWQSGSSYGNEPVSLRRLTRPSWVHHLHDHVIVGTHITIIYNLRVHPKCTASVIDAGPVTTDKQNNELLIHT